MIGVENPEAMSSAHGACGHGADFEKNEGAILPVHGRLGQAGLPKVEMHPAHVGIQKTIGLRFGLPGSSHTWGGAGF